MSYSAKIDNLVSHITNPANAPVTNSEHDFDDDEQLFAELEAELENEDYAARGQGIEALKREMERVRDMKQSGHGTYMEIKDEKEVMRISGNEPRCIVHFFHSNFRRCEIMDKHLAKLALKYFSTRFIRVFVENVPWLVEKLSIKVLPCVISFRNGVSKDRIIGFEELGNSDAFDTAVLELRFTQSGVIQKEPSSTSQPTYSVSQPARQHLRSQTHDDDEFDLD
ncbi:thioredoxin-like protein [Neolentinus lepideus HHB14362 ss-1]|uniref:Thioredoxin-like protein n=1 Tax=Neolentinus lepideus HHB14362 ss-1 TaxID=1314782 RepID=A0A165TLR1_9AGAM|nr:thioredoxin-like protein [Neolentinus lepideus HHB14362 ss-1]